MEFLSFEENPTDGVTVLVDTGTRKMSVQVPTKPSASDTPIILKAREALKAHKGKVKALPSQKDIKKQVEKKADESAQRQIDQVNADLKSLGSRQIKSAAEIQNAKAFILISRAKIFEDNDGA